MKNFGEFFQAINRADKTPNLSEGENNSADTCKDHNAKDNLDNSLGHSSNCENLGGPPTPPDFRTRLCNLFRKWFLLILAVLTYIAYKLFGNFEKHKLFRILSATLYALLEKWYLLIVGPSMYITYKLFDALEQHKVFQILYDDASKALNQMIDISNRCFTKISDIDAFFSCF